jgi:hypothetical protein
MCLCMYVYLKKLFAVIIRKYPIFVDVIHMYICYITTCCSYTGSVRKNETPVHFFANSSINFT